MISNILWDFDGVIIDSLAIRDYGFREIFRSFDNEDIEKLIKYHNLNGGLSRFHKINYFFNTILKQEIGRNEIWQYADKFTQIMRQSLSDKKYLINDTVNFIKNNYKKYNFHIVSGSEHNELNFLCQKLDLSQYFISINGSPTPKNQLIKNLLESYNYNINQTILIGDSINDYEAASINKIGFYGFNNENLKDKSKIYIEDWNNLII
ncbi:HAD family hydrolase [Campylobacter devanensis]|uniref:HAD family hydrolase n=1 Tax=Campylobacter devanensis TaxID=3161138 RepID=UPI000A33F094|nr:HAD-IA family hydrolase [Campylobacter sp. P0087]